MLQITVACSYDLFEGIAIYSRNYEFNRFKDGGKTIKTIALALLNIGNEEQLISS